MAYIGQGIKQGTFKVLDTSGNTYNGSNTTFSLGTQVGAAAQLLVSHDGVIQLPGTDYTLASGGASITFSTAPASGASIFIVEISGAVGGTVTPSDNSVGITQLNVSDGSSGQALTTNGSGTLSFASVGLAGIDDQSSSNDDQLTITDTAVVINEDSDDVDFRVESNGNANMLTVNGGSNLVGIASDPDLGTGLHIKTGDSGLSSANSQADDLVVESDGHTGITITGGSSNQCKINFCDADDNIGSIAYNHSDNNLSFRVNDSEAMRIDSNGQLLINTTSTISNDSVLQVKGNSNVGVSTFQVNGNGQVALNFRNTAGDSKGSIVINADNTTYNTTSDYRLKENVNYDFDAITRLKQLKPARFNWISDETNTLVDGFIAHEVGDIVPEAVAGEKDATETYTDENGAEQTRITPQGIDQSKLVPLLTKALQEAVTKIEALEARVTTLEG